MDEPEAIRDPELALEPVTTRTTITTVAPATPTSFPAAVNGPPSPVIPQTPPIPKRTREAAPTVFELVPVGEEGYDDRLIVPGRGFDLGRLLRCLMGAGWALVALQAIAWWGLKSDPVGIAQHVPSEVAFLLPPELRPAIKPTPSRSNTRTMAKTEPSESPHSEGDEAPSGELSNNLHASEVPTTDSYVATAAAQSTTTEPVISQSAVLDKSSTESSLTFSKPAFVAEGAAGGSAVPDYLSGVAVPPRLNPESIFNGNGPRWAKKFKQDDLDAAIAAIRKADQAFDRQELSGTDRSEMMRSAKIYYAVFCNLAERATMMKQETDVALSFSTSRDILRGVAGSDLKINMFSNAARNWMIRRLGKGVVTAAEVNAIREVGDLFEISVRLLDSQATLTTIVTRINPADNPWTTFDIGDRILLMGVLVDDPEVRLPGYLGSELSVIYMTDQVVVIP